VPNPSASQHGKVAPANKDQASPGHLRGDGSGNFADEGADALSDRTQRRHSTFPERDQDESEQRHDRLEESLDRLQQLSERVDETREGLFQGRPKRRGCLAKWRLRVVIGSGTLTGVHEALQGSPGHAKDPGLRRSIVFFVTLRLGRVTLSTGLAASSFVSRLLQGLLHLVLNLPTQRLQRFVDFAFDLFAGQLERLLHLLAHGLSDLTLQLTEDWLDGLANLLLKCLTQILLRGSGIFLVTILLLVGPTPFWPLFPVLSPGF